MAEQANMKKPPKRRFYVFAGEYMLPGARALFSVFRMIADVGYATAAVSSAIGQGNGRLTL